MTDKLKVSRAIMARLGTGPAWDVSAVTPNDSTDLPDGPCRGLYIGTSGDVKLTPAAGSTAVVFVGVPVGVLPVAASRVYDTGTDADDILALY